MSRTPRPKKSSECISEFLGFMRAVQSEYEASCKVVSECENESCDLLHQIELGPYKDRDRFATQLAHCLRRRRKHKDYTEIHQKLYEYFKDNKEAVALYRRMEQFLGDVRKSERRISSSRAYHPRVRNDLTIKTSKES